jgi:hypothetical protein
MALTIADAELMMLPTQGEGAIVALPAIQQRVTLDSEKVAEYAELYANGHDLGRLVVFQTDGGWRLADGFHRLQAARRVGLDTLPCAVYHGTWRDAVLYATSCNLHGKPLTNADKRKRVQTLLADLEWQQWSDHAIARHCGVTQPFVGSVRKSLITVISEEMTSPSLVTVTSEDGIDASLHSEISDNGTAPTRRTYRDRYGHVRTMETTAIGQQAPAPPPETLVRPSKVDNALYEALGLLETLETYYRTTPHLFALHGEGYLALTEACRRFAALGAPAEPPTPAPASELALDPTPTRLRDQVGGLQQAVFQTVEQLGTCTNAQVKAALGEPRNIVYKALQALVQHGKIVKEGETYRTVEAA